MKTKNIKVAYTSRYTDHTITTVPKLQVEGKWLSELGFTVGSTIRVEYEEGAVHFRLLTAEEKAEQDRSAAEAEMKRKHSEMRRLQHDLKQIYSEFPCLAEASGTYSHK